VGVVPLGGVATEGTPGPEKTRESGGSDSVTDLDDSSTAPPATRRTRTRKRGNKYADIYTLTHPLWLPRSGLHTLDAPIAPYQNGA
jgi:hypothetical protein